MNRSSEQSSVRHDITGFFPVEKGDRDIRSRSTVSILFDDPSTSKVNMETPAFFSDLNLDQVFSSVTAGREEYDLLSFFSTPLEDVGGITYRQEIFKDLERPELREIIQAFAKNQRSMRQQLKKADKFYYERQKESWFLEAVNTYCDAVNDLADLLFTVEMRSRGLLTIREHLAAYIRSEGFTSLVAETKNLKEMISAISYCIHIKGNMVIVDRCGRQSDYSTEVESIFKKFQQGVKKDYLFKLFDPEEMNHVEAAILDLVADLFTNVFDALRDLKARRARGRYRLTVGPSQGSS